MRLICLFLARFQGLADWCIDFFTSFFTSEFVIFVMSQSNSETRTLLANFITKTESKKETSDTTVKKY